MASGKKILKGITKVATLGIEPGKIAGALSGGLVGENVYGSQNPLNGITGQATIMAAEQAAKAQAQVQAQQAVIQQNALSLQANNAVDNTVTAVVGGTADANDTSGDFKRKRSSSISTALGVS